MKSKCEKIIILKLIPQFGSIIMLQTANESTAWLMRCLFWLIRSSEQDINTHSAGVAWIQTMEVLCNAGYGLSQGSHQLSLLYVL